MAVSFSFSHAVLRSQARHESSVEAIYQNSFLSGSLFDPFAHIVIDNANRWFDREAIHEEIKIWPVSSNAPPFSSLRVQEV